MTTTHKRPLRGPDPVGAKGMRTLADILRCEFYWLNEAPRQIERLRRSGYVAVAANGRATVTAAGRALLERGG